MNFDHGVTGVSGSKHTTGIGSDYVTSFRNNDDDEKKKIPYNDVGLFNAQLAAHNFGNRSDQAHQA
jgi:hypothetical protein